MKEKMTVDEFCDTHDVFDVARKWMVQNCRTMYEVWHKAPPEFLFWVASCEGVLLPETVRQAALFFTQLAMDGETDVLLHELWREVGSFACGESDREVLAAKYDEVVASLATRLFPCATWPVLHTAKIVRNTSAHAGRWLDSALYSAGVAIAAQREAAGDSVDVCITVRDEIFAQQADWLRRHAEPCFDAAVHRGTES